jgi:hypothetical protein
MDSLIFVADHSGTAYDFFEISAVRRYRFEPPRGEKAGILEITLKGGEQFRVYTEATSAQQLLQDLFQTKEGYPVFYRVRDGD